MLKQIEKRKIEELEYRLERAYAIINELIGVLNCPSDEIKLLVKDMAIEFVGDRYEDDSKKL